MEGNRTSKFEEQVKSADLACILVDHMIYIVWKEGFETGWLVRCGQNMCCCSECCYEILNEQNVTEQLRNIGLKAVAVGYEFSVWPGESRRDLERVLGRRHIAALPLNSSEIYAKFMSVNRKD